jgi:hypothetical protein
MKIRKGPRSERWWSDITFATSFLGKAERKRVFDMFLPWRSEIPKPLRRLVSDVRGQSSDCDDLTARQQLLIRELFQLGEDIMKAELRPPSIYTPRRGRIFRIPLKIIRITRNGSS